MATAACKYFFRSDRIFSTLWAQTVRLKSDAHVAVTEDSSTVVFWHPEKSFPYEKSLPIPKKPEVRSDSVLRMQSNKEFLSSLKGKSRNDIAMELARITYTTKHIWFPPKNQFKRKKRPEDNRPYL